MNDNLQNTMIIIVAPLAGAWIEIKKDWVDGETITVAPLAGAWIEIFDILVWVILTMSLPSRERGLKSLV